jgi:hypothetical protein
LLSLQSGSLSLCGYEFCFGSSNCLSLESLLFVSLSLQLSFKCFSDAGVKLNGSWTSITRGDSLSFSDLFCRNAILQRTGGDSTLLGDCVVLSGSSVICLQLNILCVLSKKVLKGEHLFEDFHESEVDIHLSTYLKSGAIDWEVQSISVILREDNVWKKGFRGDLSFNVKSDIETSIVVIEGFIE